MSIKCEVFKARSSINNKYFSIAIVVKHNEQYTVRHYLDKNILESFGDYDLFKKEIKKYNGVFIRNINSAESWQGWYDYWAFKTEEDAINCQQNLIEPILIAGMI